MTMNDPSVLSADRFAHALTPEDEERHPAYAALGRRLSRSATACAILDRVEAEQRNPILIFAILHYLALSGNERLERLYASLSDGASVDPEDFAATVTQFLEDEPELIIAQLHRRTQTNEVGRSAVLRAVLAKLKRRGLERVDLIDIGASAGLNLYLDHYPVSNTQPVAGLTLYCDAIGDPVPTEPLPEIGARVGIDLNPLDLTRPDDVRWLNACLWPEDVQRIARFKLVESLRPNWEPVTLLAGSATARLDDALALCASEHVVVYHTWVVAYFSREQQEELAAKLRELVATGRVTWLSMEWRRMVPGLELPAPTTTPPIRGNCQIAVAEAPNDLEHWGWCHHHGRWIALPFDGPKA